MDVPDDEAVPEGFHCVAEDVPVDGLDNVFHEFGSVGFDAFPFLCGSHAFIGDGLPAELIDPDAGLHIGQQAARGKLDEEHSVFYRRSGCCGLPSGYVV